MNKRGDKIISVYWFAILFIVTAAIVYMASLFYGAPYDVREIEANILTEHIADCLAEGGYLRQGVLNNENFKNNFLEECNLTFNVEDAYGWKEQEQYYISVSFYEFDQNASSGFGNRIFNITKGNANLETFAVLEDMGKVERDIDTIVIHYTAGDTAEGAIRAIRNAKLSVHYMIDKYGFVISADNEGEIVSEGLFERKAFVSESKIAQHAGCYDTRAEGGIGEWRPKCSEISPECLNYTGLLKEECKEYLGGISEEKKCCIRGFNLKSIGIELVSLGDVFSDEQINSLANLVADIASRNNIPIDREHIIGHEEITNFKSDPGQAFPWDSFIEKVKQRERLSPGIGKSFYVLDKTTNKPYIIKILAIVRKTEKNEA